MLARLRVLLAIQFLPELGPGYLEHWIVSIGGVAKLVRSSEALGTVQYLSEPLDAISLSL